MTALGIAAGVCVVIFLCAAIFLRALSYWIMRRAQDAADFDALAEALTPPEGADELASDHWGVPG